MSRARWALIVALLISVGFNLGLLVPRFSSPAPEPATNDTSAGAEASRFRPLIERVVRELDLSGEKRREFVAIQRRFFETTIAARTEVHSLQSALRRELGTDRPDRARIDELLDELGAARLDLERAFVENLLASKEILDPQQERRFVKMIGRLRQAREDRERALGPRRPPWRRAPGQRPGG